MTLKKVLYASCLLWMFSAAAIAKDRFPSSPVLNDGKKWHMAYYEGGEYLEYQKVLLATIKGLMKLGWIETAEIPAQVSQ